MFVSYGLQRILPPLRVRHCDETPWHIYGNKDDSGYMWVMSNQAGAFYQYEPTRSGEVVEEMLEGYKGPVLSDGYSGYNRLKKMKGITVQIVGRMRVGSFLISAIIILPSAMK